METQQFSGIILAGGFSSRMGRNKADLVLDGSRLIEHQVHKLQNLGITDIMLSGYKETLTGTRCIPDQIPHKGPLSGLHACLCRAENPACLVISVDVPLVPEEVLFSLLKAHAGGITALIHKNGKIEPLMAVYDCSLAGAAENLLHSERTAVMRLLEQTELQCVQFEGDEILLSNCNTAEDFEKVSTFFCENKYKLESANWTGNNL